MDDRFLTKVEMLKPFRIFYQQYETEESRKRIGALREVIRRLNAEGITSTLIVSGSLVYGMCTEESDIDFFYVGDTKPYSGSELNLYVRLISELAKMLRAVLGRHVELDCIDVISRTALEQELRDIHNLNGVFRSAELLYKKGQLDLPLDNSLDDVIGAIESARVTKPTLDQALRVDRYSPDSYQDVPTARFYLASFRKYNDRLIANGIRIPKHIQHQISLLETSF